MEKILSVEDDEKLAKIIKLMLTNKGYEVVCAKSLNQAMQQLSRYTKPNCIVLFQNDLPDVVGL